MLISNPFPITPVFEWNYRSLKPIVVNQGGTNSGKTFSILEVLLMKAIETPNTIITVAGKSIPDLKVGPMRDLKTILNLFPFFAKFIEGDPNLTDRIWTFTNGSIIEFKSYQTKLSAQSGKRDYLFVNEANNVPYAIFNQLQLRTSKQVFIDYNPTAPFWAHDVLIGRQDVDLFISNYKHNGYFDDLGEWNYNVPKSIRDKIELYKTLGFDSKGNIINEDMANHWNVYGLGITGALMGVVFKDVIWVPELPPDNLIKKTVYGLDFGFTNDPTCLVKLVLSQGEIYGQMLLYDVGLTNPDIARKFKELGLKSGRRSGSLIMADSAEPKSIKELNNLGWRVKPCKKGADSINFGISSLKSYGTLNLVENTLWKEEQRNYTWSIDKLTGKPTNKPIDSFNHIWDASRYGEQGFRKLRNVTISYSA